MSESNKYENVEYDQTNAAAVADLEAGVGVRWRDCDGDQIRSHSTACELLDEKLDKPKHHPEPPIAVTGDDQPAAQSSADTNSILDGNNGSRREQMTASDRRREFRQQLAKCDAVTSVRNLNVRNVVEVHTQVESKTVWMHYSSEFNFFGGAEQKNEDLTADSTDLLHAFIGSGREECFIIPDQELHSGQFYMPVQNKKGNNQWRFNLNDGNPPNSERLSMTHTKWKSWFRN
jgi:hypothetical protein